MIRTSRTRFTVRLLAALAVLASLVLTGSLLTDSQQVSAGNQTPPPPGTIYYQTTQIPSTFDAVKADGSGQTTDVLPNLISLTGSTFIDFIFPSYHPYGTSAIQDRWWIVGLPTGETYDEVHYANGSVKYDVPHHDLFAVRTNPANRSQWETVQLTDLYGIVLISAGTCGWSNDSNEAAASFVQGVYEYDIRNAFDDSTGTTIVDVSKWTHCLVTVPLTAMEIQEGWLANDFVPFGPASATEAEIDAAIQPLNITYSPASYQGAFSPDGTQFFCLTGNQSLIMDAVQGTVVKNLWVFSTSVGWGAWSPDGKTVAMNDVAYSGIGGGNIWTQPASGASPPKKVLSSGVKGGTTTTYSHPIWSPDNKYLAVVKTQWTGTTLTAAWITRLSLADSKTLDLVQIPNPAGGVNTTLRWVADN